MLAPLHSRASPRSLETDLSSQAEIVTQSHFRQVEIVIEDEGFDKQKIKKGVNVKDVPEAVMQVRIDQIIITITVIIIIIIIIISDVIIIISSSSFHHHRHHHHHHHHHHHFIIIIIISFHNQGSRRSAAKSERGWSRGDGAWCPSFSFSFSLSFFLSFSFSFSFYFYF